MPLFSVIIILLLIGALMWAVKFKVKFLTEEWKTGIYVVTIVAVVLWLLNIFGVYKYLSAVHT